MLFCVSSQQDFLTKISTRKISQLGAELTRCLDKAHLPSAMCAPAVQSRVEEPCGDLALGWRPAPPHNGFDPQLLPAIAIFAPSPSSSPSHCSQGDHQLHQLQSFVLPRSFEAKSIGFCAGYGPPHQFSGTASARDFVLFSEANIDSGSPIGEWPRLGYFPIVNGSQLSK